MSTTASPPRWRFTVEDLARMLQAGILSPNDRIELIDGEVRLMAPIGPGHVSTVIRINDVLTRHFSSRALVSVQNPIQLNDLTEPQPDFSVLRRREDFYASAIPRAADVLLIVEVADTSLEYDRQEKVPLYAEAGIPEVWIVDVVQATLTRYAQPTDNRYLRQQTLTRGDTLNADILGPLQLRIDDLVG